MIYEVKQLTRLLVVIISLATTSANAASFEERERAAVDKLNSANRMAKYHGVFRRAFDAISGQEESLLHLMDLWQQAGHTYLAGWFELLVLMDLPAGITIAQLENQVRSGVRIQAERLAALKRFSRRIMVTGREAQRLSAPQKPLPDAPDLTPYRPLIDSLYENEARLRQIADSYDSVVLARLQELVFLGNQSHAALLAKLEISLSEQQSLPLRETLDRVSALVDAQAIVEPLLAELTEREHDLNTYALHLYAFHLEDEAQPARQACTAVRERLAGLMIPPAYVASAQSRAEQLCDALEGHISTLDMLVIPRSDLLAETIFVERTEVASLCAQTQRARLACERLALLAGTPRSEFAALSQAELRFIEYAWVQSLDEVRSNRRTQ